MSPTTAFRNVGLLAAVPESFNFMGKLTTGTADALGKLFSPSGVAEYSKNFTSDAPKAGSQADQNRPLSLVGIVDQGSDLVGNDLWTLLLLLGNISLILAAVQPAAGAADPRRWARRDRGVRVGGVEDQAPPGRGRLPQGAADRRGVLRRS